jgi:hypothetical protein
MSDFLGTPSDEDQEILATGRSGVTTIFVSMNARHPEGRDADFLKWHNLDHRPEQYRLPALRGSLRFVSTPECRDSRARSDIRYDAVDHIVTYFYSTNVGPKQANDLAVALLGAGRTPSPLPVVDRGAYSLEGLAAAPRIKVGADVLLWRPLRGVYLVIERGGPAPSDLVDVPGVAGVWWAVGCPMDSLFPSADGIPLSSSEGLQITFCFLDDDPVATAPRLSEALEVRWADNDMNSLLAAPFYPVEGYDYDRHLP